MLCLGVGLGGAGVILSLSRTANSMWHCSINYVCSTHYSLCKYDVESYDYDCGGVGVGFRGAGVIVSLFSTSHTIQY